MNEGDVIVLWATEDTPAACPWLGVWLRTSPPGLHILPVAPSLMGDAVRALRARGPIVAVVGTDADIDRALAAGADEAVRADAVSRPLLAASGHHARLRAAARSDPASAMRANVGTEAVELLASSMDVCVVTPLAVATLSADIVRAALPSVTSFAAAHARDLRGGAPAGPWASFVLEEPGAASSAAELRATMDDLASTLRRALVGVAGVHALVSPKRLCEPCDLSAELADLERLVRGAVERWAEFRAEVSCGPCFTAVPRAKLVPLLSAMLANAVRAVRARGERGVIMMSAWANDDSATVEVSDDGAAMSPAARAFALEPDATLQSGTDAGRWLFLVEEAQRAGGRLLLDPLAAVGTTSVRLIVPRWRSDARARRPGTAAVPLPSSAAGKASLR